MALWRQTWVVCRARGCSGGRGGGEVGLRVGRGEAEWRAGGRGGGGGESVRAGWRGVERWGGGGCGAGGEAERGKQWRSLAGWFVGEGLGERLEISGWGWVEG